MVCQPPRANGTRVAKNRRHRTPKEQQLTINSLQAGGGIDASQLKQQKQSLAIHSRGKGVPQRISPDRRTNKGCCFKGKQQEGVGSGQNQSSPGHSRDYLLSMQKEEEIVKGILDQWGKGAHGFIPTVKEDDIILLGCKNVNSLSMYNQKETKMRRSINLHKIYQMDATCILEHGTNFSM
jgi:hypothetical protein